MHAILVGLFAWLSAGIIQRALTGAGLALGTYLILSPIIDSSLNTLTSSFNVTGTSGDILSAVLSCGISDFITIIVSAYLTRFAFLQLQMFVVRQAGTS